MLVRISDCIAGNCANFYHRRLRKEIALLKTDFDFQNLLENPDIQKIGVNILSELLIFSPGLIIIIIYYSETTAGNCFVIMVSLHRI